jgi:tetratricopeptide (TPR) repeat protein
LEEAVIAYRETLKEYTRERVPLRWAMTQNNLGVALRALGEREKGTKRLEEAVAACQEALKERTREQAPLDWAQTHKNLGRVLEKLGERERGTGRLGDVPGAFETAGDRSPSTKRSASPDTTVVQVLYATDRK